MNTNLSLFGLKLVFLIFNYWLPEYIYVGIIQMSVSIEGNLTLECKLAFITS